MQDVKYGGIMGSKIGILLKNRPSIPTAQRRFIEHSIPGRDGILTESMNDYAPAEIKLEFNFISKNEANWNIKASQARQWLLSGGKELSFSDDLEHFYRVLRVELSEIERVSARIGVFTVNIVLESAVRYLMSGAWDMDIASAKLNPGLPCYPLYKITGEGMCTLAVNGKKVTANVGQNLVINTELKLAYRTDGTLNNTALTGDYDDLVLKHGENDISITQGFALRIIPNWRCL